jgi:hypothetical protein
MSNLNEDITKAEAAATSASGWVKTHVMLAACLASFILGAICGFLVHRL